MGTLIDGDGDKQENTLTGVGTAATSTGGYGSYTLASGGVRTDMVDEIHAAVHPIYSGSTLSDSFTVTTVDGTAQVVSITINGANDAAVVSGTTTGSVTESGGV